MIFPELLSTPRLVLARISDTDYADYLAMHQDPRVMATLGGLRPPEELARRHQRNLDHWREHGFGWWSARLPGDGRFVGRGGLRRVVADGANEVELGYGFIPEFWGQGLAVELATASVAAGFEFLKLSDLVSFTLPTNTRSRRVMEKVGFQYEKDFVWADLPHVLYRLRRP